MKKFSNIDLIKITDAGLVNTVGASGMKEVLIDSLKLELEIANNFRERLLNMQKNAEKK